MQKKGFDKNSTSIHDKDSQYVYRGNISQHNKGHLCQSTANEIHNGEKLRALLLHQGTR